MVSYSVLTVRIYISNGLVVKAFTVRLIIDSDVNEFKMVRLEALRLHPNAFGASHENCIQKPTLIFVEQL